MLIYSMTVSADGYTADRDGRIDWSAPSDELFRVHLERVQSLGAHLLGRRLYETMLVWETDPSLREDPLMAAFADAWTALPKIVFSRTLEQVQGNARLARGTVAEEAAEAQAVAGDQDVEIGGPELAAQAFGAGLVDEMQIFRAPVVLGGGTPFFPALPDRIPLRLVESQTFGTGVISERYRRALD